MFCIDVAQWCKQSAGMVNLRLVSLRVYIYIVKKHLSMLNQLINKKLLSVCH